MEIAVWYMRQISNEVGSWDLGLEEFRRWTVKTFDRRGW
jgi:hypothetical protein